MKTMAEPFIVKPSPGRGMGVFATIALEPGDLVMRDRAKMKIERPTVDVTDEQVREAFEALTLEDKAIFNSLYQGIIWRETKHKRIYKTNSFGDETHEWMLMKIARINHSCSPNAESPASTGVERQIYAIKSIAKGEEIFITYNNLLVEGSKEERNLVLWQTNGFRCGCETCSLHGVEAFLSDGRRQLINVLSHKLFGFEPVYEPPVVNGKKTTRKFNIVGKHREALRIPLTMSEKAAYGFLLAKLLEVEDLRGIELSKAYIWAAEGLYSQLHDYNGVVFILSAWYVANRMMTAIEHTQHLRGVDSNDVNLLKQQWEELLQSSHLKIALHFYLEAEDMQRYITQDVSNIFAFDCEAKGRFMTREQCKRFLTTGKHEATRGEYLDDVSEQRNRKHAPTMTPKKRKNKKKNKKR